MKAWREWMAKYMPAANSATSTTSTPTRVVPDGRDAEEVRRQPDAREPHAAGGHSSEAQGAGLLPGITVSTSPTDFYPVQAVQLQRFKGETWELFGDVMHAEST
jgi:branched-chain amino acid transport system substrate-binding protein